MSMAKWLVVGGAGVLVYLLATSKGALAAIRPGGPAQPGAQGAPVIKPTPSVPPQTTVVAGAGSGILDDLQKAGQIAGTFADVARKFGLFGSSDDAGTTTVVAPDPVGIQRTPLFADLPGAAYF